MRTLEKTAKLWGGRFKESVSDGFEKFLEFISFDKSLHKHDIIGSRAHASMLAHQSELELLVDQTFVEQTDQTVDRTTEDYLIRGRPNRGLRWSITFAIAIAFVVRIFYFDQGYFVLTFALVHSYLDYLRRYLFSNEVSVLEASDGMAVHENGVFPPVVAIPRIPRITFLLKHTMSPEAFDSLVLSILEFKFWYTTTKRALFALLISWYSLFRFPEVGPQVLLVLIFIHGYRFARAISQKSEGVTFVDTFVLE